MSGLLNVHVEEPPAVQESPDSSSNDMVMPNNDQTAIEDSSADNPTSELPINEPTKAMTVSETLELVQNGMGIHTSASRSILLHICQRLTRLEAHLNEVRGDVYQLRQDTNQNSDTVRDEVSGVFNQMTLKLKEYENAMAGFQNDMRANQTKISVLSTTVKKEKENIQVVDTKVDNHHKDFNNRFVELTQKFHELPLQLAALQPTPPSHIPEFTFQTNDEKISLETHLHRLDGTRRSQGYTDLQPFTIPDDMKSKVEARIRQQEATKREEDARAAAELADAYRRLQLAAINNNNPRLSEMHMTLDQCQQEVKRAFQLIRTSSLELYSFCESKAERIEIRALENEMKLLRNRIRDMENAPVHRPKSFPLQFGEETTGIEGEGLVVGGKVSTPSMKKGPQHLTSSQIPVLRVSLLELSRNLNLLKHRWKKHKRMNSHSGGSVNPVALKHLEKLVSLINDAYAIMAQEPVDLAAAEAHVEKVGRVLGSDFSMQILALLGGRSDEPESCRFPVAITARAAAGEMAAALCKYSEAFTDMFFHHEADNTAATAPMNEWVEKRTLENVGQEVSALARSQHVLEVTLSKIAVALQKKNLTSGTAVEGEDLQAIEGEVDILCSWTALGNELQQLRGQVQAMSKQFVTEDTLQEALQNLKQSSPFTGGGGHLYPPSISISVGTDPLDSPSSASLLKRSSSVENGSTNQILAAITLEPPEDRARSQPKLDPLQGVRLKGSSRQSNTGGHIATRNGSATSRMNARAQMLRPKSRQLS